MQYVEEWKRLTGRIQGLVKADEVFARHQAIRNSDSFAVARRHLADHCSGVVEQVKNFRARFDKALPDGVGGVIDARMTRLTELVADTSSGDELQKQKVWSVIVLLTALEGEVSHLLSGVEQVIRELGRTAPSLT